VTADLDPSALTALCTAAMPEEHLTEAELAYLCFGDNDERFGDERAAAVLQTQTFGQHVAAWLTLAVVHPDEQSRGRGKELVHAVAERARALGAHDLLLASAVPRYLWPGVDVTNTRAGMLLESCGFERDWVGTNMAIDTAFRRAAPAGIVVERENGDGARGLAARAYPYWVPELDRAVSLGTAFAARDKSGRTIGFGCHSVSRFGWIGPMATDPALQHGGVGAAVVAELCADLEERGCATGEISWVSNLRFYGKCGARVSRVFLGGRKILQPAAAPE
jgi:GNAT superfamily N-acetyltransferase